VNLPNSLFKYKDKPTLLWCSNLPTELSYYKKMITLHNPSLPWTCGVLISGENPFE